MTIQSKNDIKGTPNGDDHDAQFDPRPKWPFWIGTGGRFPSESVAAFIGTRGEGRGVHHKVLVSCAIEVRHRKPGTKLDNRKDGRYAGRVRLAVVLDRSAESLCGFVESTVAPGSLIVTDDWSGYAGLGKRGYEHFAVAECG